MAMQDLTHPKHYAVGGVYVKELFLENVGDGVVSHSHHHDHLSLVARGKVRVTADGVVTDYPERSAVNIKAGVKHEIVALEANTLWYCLHAVPPELQGEDMLDAYVSAD